MKAETTEEEAKATNATKDKATHAFAICTCLSAAKTLFVQLQTMVAADDDADIRRYAKACSLIEAMKHTT